MCGNVSVGIGREGTRKERGARHGGHRAAKKHTRQPDTAISRTAALAVQAWIGRATAGPEARRGPPTQHAGVRARAGGLGRAVQGRRRGFTRWPGSGSAGSRTAAATRCPVYKYVPKAHHQEIPLLADAVALADVASHPSQYISKVVHHFRGGKARKNRGLRVRLI